jgi:uncharacterized protein YndB with AHSA1/START domain
MNATARGDRELVMTRQFRAPREFVFRAVTEPGFVRQWLLGPDGWTMPVCEIDLRVGGTFRYIWRNADGREMGMSGAFLEVSPPHRLVSTEKFDQAWYPGNALATVEFDEQNGLTTMTQTMRYESPEALQAVLRSGMEGGVALSFDRLASILLPAARS